MRYALRFVLAGVVLDVMVVVCCGLNLLSRQQTIAVALPGVLLTVAGLLALATSPGEAIAQRGFQAGYLLGVARSYYRWASGRERTD